MSSGFGRSGVGYGRGSGVIGVIDRSVGLGVRIVGFFFWFIEGVGKMGRGG